MRLLTLTAVQPDGHKPYSWSRGPDVGVGGTVLSCRIAPHEPKVRAATRAELRRLDRIMLNELREKYPHAVVRATLWRG